MSGFDVAAGAFAVVGVADVLVRTGREVYSFLRDVADAPNEIQRLSEVIQEITLLAGTSKQCLNDLKAHTTGGSPTGAIASFEAAFKALSRELHSVRTLILRFKGKITWANVKYVLRSSKSIGNLENAKSLLAAALTLACRYECFWVSVILAAGDTSCRMYVPFQSIRRCNTYRSGS